MENTPDIVTGMDLAQATRLHTKKKTGVGKRIFRMAPLHHHFELGGWSETRVVAVFSIITAILCLIALMAM